MYLRVRRIFLVDDRHPWLPVNRKMWISAGHNMLAADILGCPNLLWMHARVPHSLLWVSHIKEPAHSKRRVEKAMKRHHEEQSDVAISLAFT
jgi:hypothetical protein